MTIEEKAKILENKKNKREKKKIKKKIPTGSYLLDVAMEGGWDVGAISQIFADSKGGKTRFAMELIYNALVTYGGKNTKYRYNDAEAGLSFDTEEQYGFPLLNTSNHAHVPVIESVKSDILTFCDTVDPSKDQVGVYVVDSQDWLYSLADKKRTEEQRKEYKKNGEAKDIGTYGDRAKKLGETWREVTMPAYDHNTHIMIISQIRDNMNAGLFGPKHTVSGGHASKFGASKRFNLKKICNLGPDDRPYGVRVKVILDKTRTKYEGRSVYVDIVHETGIDNVKSNLLFLYDLLDEKGKDIPARFETLKWDDKYDPNTDEEGSGVSNDEYKQFIEEIGAMDAVGEMYGTKRVGNMKKYISDHPDVLSKFVEKFGVMNLNDMISYIENNDLEDELCRRVKLKWDYLENKDKPKNRKQKKRIDF